MFAPAAYRAWDGAHAGQQPAAFAHAGMYGARTYPPPVALTPLDAPAHAFGEQAGQRAQTLGERLAGGGGLTADAYASPADGLGMGGLCIGEGGHTPGDKYMPVRSQRMKARGQALTEAQRKARHNEHTRSSRLRIDEGLKRLKAALLRADPELRLQKKADIVEEAIKIVERVNGDGGGERVQESPMSP